MGCKDLISAYWQPSLKDKMNPCCHLISKPDTCLNLKNPLPLVVSLLIIAIDSQPAYANDPPGSLGEVLFTYLIPVAMITLTLSSGGYVILKQLAAKERRPDEIVTIVKNLVKFVSWIIIIFLSMAFANLALFLGLIFSIYAFKRSYNLITWGQIARGSEDKPDYLTDANATRLIYSGTALIIITVVLFSLAFMFASHGLKYGRSGRTMRQEEAALKRLVSIEVQKLAYLENKKSFQKELDSLSDQARPELEKIRDANRRYIVEYNSDQKGFKIFLLPADGSMIFTYPSYRADYFGEGEIKIRRIWVRSRDERCPEDAQEIS